MRLLVAATLLAAAGLAGAQAPGVMKTVTLQDAKGAPAGTVTLTDAPRGVLLHIEASGLTPGWHAIHFHAVGDCSDNAMGFKKSGGHTHGGAASVHGLLNPAADDTGDLPNIYADASGAVKAELFSPMVALHAAADRSNLLDADGSALVIHAAKDDFTTQPIGGAGARVACGVIR